jgi:hypothetical protein
MLRKLFIGLVLALVASLPAGPAAAAGGDHRYYGDTARQVAKQIGCKGFKAQPRGPELRPYVKSAGGCVKNGRGLAIFTFQGPKKQKTLEMYFYLGARPRDHWASGRGALIMGRNANKAAAKLGAKLLRGRVMHG